VKIPVLRRIAFAPRWVEPQASGFMDHFDCDPVIVESVKTELDITIIDSRKPPVENVLRLARI